MKYANDVLGIVRDRKPLVFTLNELCLSQYVEIREELGVEGWTGKFNASIGGADDLGSFGGRGTPTTIAQCGGSLGDAVFTKFYLGTGHTTTGTFPGSMQRPGDGGVRGYACIQGGVFLRVWTACATHLTNKGSGDQTVARGKRQLQASYFTSALCSYGTSTKRMAGGDFNDVPGYYPSIYASYDEADQNRDYNTNLTGTECGDGPAGSKIDYLWVRALDGLSTTGNATRYEICSDHLYYEGRIYFNDL